MPRSLSSSWSWTVVSGTLGTCTPLILDFDLTIFFFNNGEEDQLNGAHAYFEHPWSNLTSTFINLEGAASGG